MSGVESRIPSIEMEITKPTSNASQFTTDSGGVLISPYDPYEDAGEWRYFAFAMGIIVIVLGTAGNGLTVWAYNNNRNLQTSFNVLIANLCCIELFFSLLIIPLQLPGFILKSSPYREEVCAAIGYFYYWTMGASLHNLIAIAINRYIGIVNTKKYQRLFTGNRLRLWVISIWIVSPLLYLPLPIGGTIHWSQSTLRCSMGGYGIYEIRLYNTILNVVLQVGGLLVLIVLYSSIIKKVKQVQKKLKIHKKASFKRTNKTSTGSGAKVEIHTPGTTSGEEAVEDYRPSSVISGGFNFRPAKDAKHNEYPSDSGHGSDRDLNSHMNKPFSETQTDSKASHPLSNETSPKKEESSKKHERRTSLWQMLFRTKATKETTPNEESVENIFDLDYLTDEESRKDRTATIDSREPVEEVQTLPCAPEEAIIVLRGMDGEKKDVRRKKSLSAPTLPALEEIIAISRKNSAAVAQNIPEKVTEVNEAVSPETSPMKLNRAFTIGAKYKKNNQRTTNGSIRAGSVRNSATSRNGGTARGTTAEQLKLLSPLTISNKLHKCNKNLCTSMPDLIVPTGETPPPTPRFGTIARKIMKDQISKRYKDRGQKRKQRAKALRRRHARERQLVYSSLTICIAFAVCLLPTAILFATKTIFNLQVPAAVYLVISCLSWLHAVVNPFIYGYMNHVYRKEYGHIAKELEKKLSTCLK